MDSQSIRSRMQGLAHRAIGTSFAFAALSAPLFAGPLQDEAAAERFVTRVDALESEADIDALLALASPAAT